MPPSVAAQRLKGQIGCLDAFRRLLTVVAPGHRIAEATAAAES